MRIISHRGIVENSEFLENSPEAIDFAIKQGFEVEIDVRMIGEDFFLGHDTPDYKVEFRWFRDRLTRIWIHCKDFESFAFFNAIGYEFNYFWHQEDDYTLTSDKTIWTYPGKEVYENSVIVDLKLLEGLGQYEYAKGICTDVPLKMKTLLSE
jgi:hypothetical protein